MVTEGNILVVDDISANLDLLENVLSKQGYEVRPFPSGDMALKSAQADPPDLILLDVMMPGLDGFEVCQKLKAISETRDIPVIFISAKSVTIDKVKAFNLGGVDYVTKPFQLDEVLARVKTHLSLRKYQLESENQNVALQQALDKLKAAQSQLIQSEKMASIGVLAAGVAHEINNPINFISISTKGLKKKMKPVIDLLQKFEDAEIALEQFEEIHQVIANLDLSSRLKAIEELTTNIETGADRAVEIVSGLRSFSRLDSSKKELTDIHKTLESALIILRNQIKGEITIKKEHEDIPEIMAFPGKLAQVFMNIIKNAIDAIYSCHEKDCEKTITVRTGIDKVDDISYATVSISDTGPGIPEEIKSRIFDPFYSTKEVGKGTGLGLSIVLGIIESHQGRIEVDSSEGTGAMFTVYLPLERQED